MQLTGKQKRHLRALGHHLQPMVHAGKQGFTEGLSQAVDRALLEHELIKLRIARECPEDPGELLRKLCAAVGAELAQTLGHTALLYRRHPEEPSISLPQ